MTDTPRYSTAEKWQELVDILARMADVPSAIITRVAGDPYIEVLSASATEGNPYSAGMKAKMVNRYCEYVVKQRQRLLLPNATKDKDWENAPEIEYGIISYLGYPIFYPGGDIFGTLCILDREENHYEGNDIHMLMQQFRALIEAQLALELQQEELLAKNRELEQSLKEIKDLREILPICSHCKKVRTDDGYWERVEEYFRRRDHVDFSHGFCPDCAKLYEYDEG